MIVGLIVYTAFLVILAAVAFAAAGRWQVSLPLFALAIVLGRVARVGERRTS